MAEVLLEANDLHKAYTLADKQVHVLAGAKLQLRRGEMVSIVGASGAGKSTLLHVLGTLERPDAGALAFAGRELTALSTAALAEFRNHSLGFVFQFHHLLPDFDALENVMMPAWIRRMGDAQARALAKQALQDVGLEQRMQHRPQELSGGEQQRVALARALVLRPPLLLADEVTGNLDEKTAAGIHDLLFDLNARHGMTLVVVTHNKTLARRMPRQLLLEHGLLKDAAQEGT